MLEHLVNVISKTPNTSEYSEDGVNKIVISKQDIENLGAVDVNDVLKLIPGLMCFSQELKVKQHQYLQEDQSLIIHLS